MQAFEARKKTIFAITLEDANLFIGIFLQIFSISDSLLFFLVNSVSTKPGATELTSILSPEYSTARLLVRASKPALEEE